MSKLKLWGYPRIYFGHSDDLESAIQNNEYIEIAVNFGQETFQRISFEIWSVESCMRNTELDILTAIS